MSYFKPLDRKLGVVTLLLACVFAAGWVRSLHVVDEVTLSAVKVPSLILSSLDHSVFVTVRENASHGSMWEWVDWRTRHFIKPEVYNDHTINWLWEWHGFGIANGISVHGVPTTYIPASILSIPYWSIVFPLTLLSAWLLLSKSGIRKTPATYGKIQ